MQYGRRVRPRFYGFVIVVMLILFLVSFIVTQSQYAKAADRVTLLKGEHAQLTTRVSELKQTLEYVRSDAYVERVARDELGYIRKGEIRYVSNR